MRVGEHRPEELLAAGRSIQDAHLEPPPPDRRAGHAWPCSPSIWTPPSSTSPCRPSPTSCTLRPRPLVPKGPPAKGQTANEAAGGAGQYVLLGAGLDTFAQRRPDLAGLLALFEVDPPEQAIWKHWRLIELGYGVPEGLRLVPVDFAAGGSWRDRAAAAGFDAGRPAVVAAAGVSMYLTREANIAALQQVATPAPGTIFATTFLLPDHLTAPELRPGLRRAAKGARANGTPFIRFFAPDEMLQLARSAGFRDARHVSAEDLSSRYFVGRTDGLHRASGEELLVVLDHLETTHADD
ncbi:MAG: class I SAM-dependent methyltransferase [Acidimicrobiales bacterium]